MNMQNELKNRKNAVQIKICGITRRQEIDKLLELRVNYAGFVIFYEKSRRNNTIEQARELLQYLKEQQMRRREQLVSVNHENPITRNSPLRTVAVVVSPSAEQLCAIEKAGFDMIQIHGVLSEEVREQCRLPIWRAFHVSEDADNKTMQSLLQEIINDEKIAAVVLDGATAGGGQSFNWRQYKSLNFNHKLFVLAGGLNAGNVEQAIHILAPNVIDVSSGVEYDDKSKTGKDLQKVEEFVLKVHRVS